MVHLDASRLLDNVHATLIRWVQDICDSRGVDCPTIRMVPRDFIGPLRPLETRGHATGATRSAAIWLAKNVNAIACDVDETPAHGHLVYKVCAASEWRDATAAYAAQPSGRRRSKG